MFPLIQVLGSPEFFNLYSFRLCFISCAVLFDMVRHLLFFIALFKSISNKRLLRMKMM